MSRDFDAGIRQQAKRRRVRNADAVRRFTGQPAAPDADQVWRELVEARREALDAQATLEALQRRKDDL